MRKLNIERVNKTYEFIREFQTKNAKNPTYREIMCSLKYNSLGTIKNDIDYLIKRGMLQLSNSGVWNKILLPDNLETGEFHNVPIVGSCACGEPTFAIENIESTIALPDSIFGHGNQFILKAKGRSMINCGIFDGDLMVVNKDRSPKVDDIVIALLNNDEATAKILSKNGNKYYLSPGNDEVDDNGQKIYNNIPIDMNSRIIGVVDKVIHTPTKNSYK